MSLDLINSEYCEGLRENRWVFQIMVYLLHYLPGVGEGDVVQPEDLGVLAQKQELVLHDLDPADEGADLEGRGAVERHVRPRHRSHVLRRGLRQIVDI